MASEKSRAPFGAAAASGINPGPDRPDRPYSCADEQRAIDEITKLSLTHCQQEGLTQAQLDCLLAATDWERIKQIGDCPAIKAKPPTWLVGI